MRRLFSALLPPPAVADELTAAVSSRLTGLPHADRLRWTPRTGWHITLAFYGETPDDRLPTLRARLATASRRNTPFALRLAGGEALGDWALGTGVAGDRESLTALAAACDAAAVTPNPDRYPTYRPHLTLARAPREDGAAIPLTPFAEALRPFTGTAWHVAELALMSSTDDARHYDRVACWPLGLP